MNILIIEPNSSGHHMAMHLPIIIRKLNNSKIKMSLLTTRSAMNSKSYLLAKAEMPKNINHYFLPDFKNNKQTPINILLKQIKTWLALKKEFLKIMKIDKPDVILIPTFDWIINSIEIFGSPFDNIPFTGVFVSPKFHIYKMCLSMSTLKNWSRNFLFKRLLKIQTLKRLLTFEQSFVDHAKYNYKDLSNKVSFIPDFGLIELQSSKKDARLKLGINQNSKVILVYGSLSLRKGIKELLNIMYNKKLINNLVILLSGKADREIIELINDIKIINLISSKRLIINFKFHNAFEEQQAFAAADAIWLGYTQGFASSSGVLFQAIKANLLVIGQPQGIIGLYTKKYKLGVIVSPNNKDQVAEKIFDLFNNYKFYFDQGIKSRKFLNDLHSPSKYSEVLIKSLQ